MRKGFEVQKAAVVALFFREIHTRFGRSFLGYVSALLGPFAHVAAVVIVLTYIMGNTTRGGMSMPTFCVSGLVPWFLFRDIVTRSLGAVEANRGLFDYRPVKPIDTVVARTALEYIFYGAVYIVLALFVWLLGAPLQVSSFVLLVVSFVLLGWLGFGVGIICMVVSDASGAIAKFLPMLIQLFYIISGIIFPVEIVPKDYQMYFIWNPIFHAVEMSRISVAEDYVDHGASLAYVVASTLVTNVLGLLLYRLRENKMLTR